MAQTVLVTASTYSHIRNFHLPYLLAFQAAGWQVHVACPDPPAEIPGVDRVLSVPFVKQMSAPRNLKAVVLLRQAMRGTDYDLVITHTSLAAFFTRLAVLTLSAPRRPRSINVVHGYLFDADTPALKRRLLLGAEQLTVRVTDLLLTMNRQDYDMARASRLGRRIEMIPGIGADFSRFDGRPSKNTAREALKIPSGAFVFLYAAEFSARKNHHLLLQAAARLPEHVHLLLPGQGDLLAQCREEAKRLGLSHRVLFPGQVESISACYAAADAVVSTSRGEGLPFHLMEGMYCALPVAASHVKGHEDLIRSGENGLLFSPDSAEACAQAMLDLISDPVLARRLGQTAQADSAQYDLSRVLPIVLARYGLPVPVAAG